MEQTKVNVKDWLARQLRQSAEGSVAVHVLQSFADSDGISLEQLHAAKEEMGLVVGEKQGQRAWSLPFGYGLIQVFADDSEWYVDRDMVPTPRVIRRFRSGIFAGIDVSYHKTEDGKGWVVYAPHDTTIPVPELTDKLEYLLKQAERAK